MVGHIFIPNHMVTQKSFQCLYYSFTLGIECEKLTKLICFILQYVTMYKAIQLPYKNNMYKTPLQKY